MQRAFHELIRAAETAADQVAKGPVCTDVGVDEVRRAIASFDFVEPRALLDLVRDVTQMLAKWTVHVTHPRYFGLFNPSVTLAGIVGDTIAAIYNPQLASWSHAPAAQEMERHVLRWLGAKLGITEFANFTSGGAEANQSALLCAMARAFPSWRKRGVRGRPVILVTSETHHSFAKAAVMAGLGTDALRRVDVDRDGRMEMKDLAAKVKQLKPFLVVGTAGTTSSGVIDPLGEIADILQKRNVWFHADAAWGGAAAVSPSLRRHLDGIERADSITCDAHKWFSVPMGAGMFFTRHRDAVERAFAVETPYMPAGTAGTDHPFETTVQWSRRFIGLKLFLTIAELGERGIAERIDHQARMGEYLRSALTAAGWKRVNRTPFPLVCFTRQSLDVDRFLRRLLSKQIAWMSSVRIAGRRPVVRACITSFRTTERDIDDVVVRMRECL